MALWNAILEQIFQFLLWLEQFIKSLEYSTPLQRGLVEDIVVQYRSRDSYERPGAHRPNRAQVRRLELASSPYSTS